ncbi:MAG: hypothetical protein JXX14_19205, partial [Deltaproteobacteria bacterium]|nr:hypothetical protein [Deltaproteobacteria bacterium]
MYIFLIFFLGIIAAIHFYIWRRLVLNTQLKSPLKTIATLTIVALAISIPATMFLSRAVPFETVKTFATAPLIWMGSMLLTVTFLGLTDLFFLMRHLIGKATQSKSPISDTLLDPGRRDSLRKIAAAGTLGMTGTLTTASFIRVQTDATVISQQIFLSKLPPSLNGLRIVQISDIHIGLTLDGAFLSRIVDQVNRLNPDIIAITGDLIDGSVSQ